MSHAAPRRRAARSLLAVALAAAIIVAHSAPTALAGPINPPAGPVAPTGKTLTEVEPRIAVNAQNTPGDSEYTFRITQPGSYYLTGNVLGEVFKHGVLIDAHNVTLDLNGFALIGVPGAVHGVHMTGFRENVIIRNGNVRSWMGGISSAIDNGAIEGIRASANLWGIRNDPSSFSTRIENCEAYNNPEGGISSGQASLVTNCVARSNGTYGISVNHGSQVTNCVIRGTTGPGIQAVSSCLIANNTVTSSSGAEGDGIRVIGAANRIDGNNVVACTGAGIRVQAAGNFIVRNSARTNTGGNYVTTGLQTIGPIITATGTIADTVSPWANFSF